MAGKNRTSAGIKTVVFMFSVTFIYVLILSFVNLYTRPVIKRNEKLFLKRSVLYTADIPVPEDEEELDTYFMENIIETEVEGSESIYKLKNGSLTVNTVSGAGLWGVIKAHVGFNTETGELTGVDFIEQNETPGLGARITEKWFREQFRGKKGPFTYVPEGGDDGKNQFDAITGATVTTKAVQNIVNKAAEINISKQKEPMNEQ